MPDSFEPSIAEVQALRRVHNLGLNAAKRLALRQHCVRVIEQDETISDNIKAVLKLLVEGNL